MPHELALVMPVYNEEACVAGVVCAWLEVLGGLGIDFRMIVLNDGSGDRTAEVLAQYGGDARIEAVNKPNSGHGPTILEGYRRAVEVADWVFQCDSDDEMTADHFAALWTQRRQYDLLLGYRVGRRQGLGRRVISAVSRVTVRLSGGGGVRDVNTPYRLMRADLLRQVIGQIPPDTFAPNVIISGAFAHGRARILNHPVPHQGRRTGSVSIVKWRLWKAASRSFWQTLRCRPTLRL